MASNTVWGLDIGNSAIKAVKLTRVGAVCKVADFDIVDIPYAEDDKDREPRVEAALTELLNNHRFGSDPVHIALTGNICLAREFQLPATSEDKLKDLIQYEAKQQIPFPLDQVEWGYERYEDPAGVGVVLIAVRKNDIQELLTLTDKFHLNVEGITTGPMALFNFVQYEFNPASTTLILDAGARGTDFVVLNKRQIYSRTIQIAGREITRVLENKFKVSYQKAEELKKNISQSAQMEKILSVIEPTLRQLGAEVQRTIGFYKSRARGQRIAQCYLLGHTFRLPKMAEYLQTQVREAPFAIVEGLQRIKLDPSCNATVWEQEFPTMAVAIGLSLQGVGCGELTLNLLPAERKARQGAASWKVWAVASAAVVLITAGLSYWQATSMLASYTLKKNNAITLKNEISRFEDEEKAVAATIPARKVALNRLARVARDRGRASAILAKLMALRTENGTPFFGAANRTYLSGLYVSRMPVVTESSGEGLHFKDLAAVDTLTGAASMYTVWAKAAQSAASLPPELRPDVPLTVVLSVEVDAGVSEYKFAADFDQVLKKLEEVKDPRVKQGAAVVMQPEAPLTYDWYGKRMDASGPAAGMPAQISKNTFHAVFRWQDPADRDIEAAPVPIPAPAAPPAPPAPPGMK